ncbi:MAG: hypothetical protein ACLU80_02125 [Dorea sp.]
MAVKRCESSIDVVTAAEIRIKNVFRNGLPVFFSFSGGKDSLCVAQLLVNLANRGEIDMKQLTVQFIDEEAILSFLLEQNEEIEVLNYGKEPDRCLASHSMRKAV